MLHATFPATFPAPFLQHSATLLRRVPLRFQLLSLLRFQQRFPLRVQPVSATIPATKQRARGSCAACVHDDWMRCCCRCWLPEDTRGK
jgi:hypothetical protein